MTEQEHYEAYRNNLHRALVTLLTPHDTGVVLESPWGSFSTVQRN